MRKLEDAEPSIASALVAVTATMSGSDARSDTWDGVGVTAPARQRVRRPGRVPLDSGSHHLGRSVELAVSHLGDARARREGRVPRVHPGRRRPALRRAPTDARNRGLVAAAPHLRRLRPRPGVRADDQHAQERPERADVAPTRPTPSASSSTRRGIQPLADAIKNDTSALVRSCRSRRARSSEQRGQRRPQRRP